MKRFIESFGFPLVVSILACAVAFGVLGWKAGIVIVVLAAIEMAFSFDNAVLNAKVVGSLSRIWQQLFLTLGIVIAVFGVRALLPVLIVALASHTSIGGVVTMALFHPLEYARSLTYARPAIVSFGGAFLMLISLNFFMAERDVKWIGAIEQPLSKLGRWWFPILVSAIALLVVVVLPWNRYRKVELIAGSIGLLTYIAMEGLIRLIGKTVKSDAHATLTGWVALATFMYLELLDASLSFDGVIGAFAITSSVILIALGLGIGAVWVRSLTLYIVKHRTLETYKYLEHGAHYAIAVLAAIMLIGPIVTVPDVLTGILSIGLIGAAALTSWEAMRKAS